MSEQPSNTLHYHVYVIELDTDVLKSRKFREANPRHNPRRPCVYVGMTGIGPEERFEQHRSGYKASRYVKRYGVRLMPKLYRKYNPMEYEEAVERERRLADRLRRRGYAVWQN